MTFGKGERRRTKRTSNENLPKSTEIAAFGKVRIILVWHAIFTIKLTQNAT